MLNSKTPFSKLHRATCAVWLALGCAGAMAQTADAPVNQASSPAPAAAPAATPAGSVFHAKNVRWFTDYPPLPEDLKTAGLSIVFQHSPTMTANLEAAFKAAGFNVMPPETAKYKYQIGGSYKSDGKVKLAAVPLGQILEAGLSSKPDQPVDWARVATDTTLTAGLANQAVQAGLMNRIVAGGNILDAILKSTGLAGKFNEALTGDRRGICLGSCTTWHWSEQMVTIGFTATGVSNDPTRQMVFAGLHASALWPQDLINLALLEMYRRLGLNEMPEAKNPDGATYKSLFSLRRAAQDVKE